MKLFNILLLTYLLLIVADDFTVWAFGKWLGKLIGNRDAEDLPKATYRKVTKIIKAKRITRTVIRVLQVTLLVPIASAVIVGVGMIIITF